MEAGPFLISRRQRILHGLLGLAVLVGVAFLNELAFRTWLDTDYPRWYLDNGAAIGFVFTLVTLAWGDINRIRGLISANPLIYIAASLELGAATSASLGAMVRADREDRRAQRKLKEAHRRMAQRVSEGRPALEQFAATTSHEDLRRQIVELLAQFPVSEPSEPEDAPAEPLTVPTGLPVVDIVLALLFALVFALATLAWLLVVVPLQYFVNLVTGAPARVALASPTRATVENERTGTIFSELLKSDPLPKDAIESGFTAQPVSFTAGITTAVLFAVPHLT